jgi:hypothetical protein
MPRVWRSRVLLAGAVTAPASFSRPPLNARRIALLQYGGTSQPSFCGGLTPCSSRETRRPQATRDLPAPATHRP